MNKEELQEILTARKPGERVDLRLAELRGTNLCGADMRGVDMCGADLREVSLYGTNLRGADMRHVDMRHVDMRDADMREVDMRWADLCGADLRGARGLILLPVQDMRGISFIHAVECGNEWRIRGGCRDGSIDEAMNHFDRDYPDQLFAQQMRYAIRWLCAWLALRQLKVAA